jgi:hypothetical protein
MRDDPRFPRRIDFDHNCSELRRTNDLKNSLSLIEKIGSSGWIRASNNLTREDRVPLVLEVMA